MKDETKPKTAERLWKEMEEEFAYGDPNSKLNQSCNTITHLRLLWAKEYARTVAQQVRQECAEKAKIMSNGTSADGIPLIDSYPVVDKESILSIDIEQFIK